MLFGNDPTIAILTVSNIVTILGLAGGGIAWFLKWLRDGKKEDKKEKEQDDKTALEHLEDVMQKREDDCNKRVTEVTRRLTRMEGKVEVMERERGGLVTKLATAFARISYYRSLLRKAGVTDEWNADASDALPSLDLPTQTPPPNEEEPR